MCLSMQALRRTHRYPITQDLVKYNEGWYETPEGPERIRSIEDSEILVEDTSEREG